MENEIWVSIPNYNDYKISNYGRIKSLKYGKEKLMKLQINDRGYYQCVLLKYNKPTKVKPHQLVATVFLGHKKCGMKLVVDHIDGNKLNNKLSNLRIVTSRQNSINHRISNTDKYTSKYVGVYLHKGKAMSCITIKGKNINLGTFKTEEEAHLAYLKRLALVSCSE